MYSGLKRVVNTILPQRLYLRLGPGLRYCLKWLYYGKRHYCPCCNTGLRKLVVNSHICPACGSGKRHRFQWLFLEREYDLFRTTKTVLNIAPMRHFQDYCIRFTQLNYRSADLNSELAMDKIDLTATTYHDSSFDFILCSHVLEHIPNDQQAITEMYRILKPGGTTIIQVPLQESPTYENPDIITAEERLIHFGQSDHVRIYGLDIKERLETAGFQIHVEKCSDIFSAREIDYYGLDKTEILFVGYKQF